MEEKIRQLLDAAKSDKAMLRSLKNTALKCQCYSLATELRDLELQLYPETDESKAAKRRSAELSGAFRMVGLNIPEETCFLIDETIKAFNEKKAEFSLRDAAAIEVLKETIFGKD